ncbi:FtsK/SpoIIIE domain-containing protein [Streptacidiphilus anmyonensis]|uniref:FtsK/SpoIIIE domain-containing protein n=1 Tax=Streptacidiphilus anmyonensis TaxID=405782 RepID=UPI000A41AEBD|nr:FtsK/SpoIIIE domain-containing protein [Streptacidiphilus anmyonensis]
MTWADGAAGCGGLVGAACEMQRQQLSDDSGVGVRIFWTIVILGTAAALSLRILAPTLRAKYPQLWWRLIGFPLAWVRVLWTWRKLAALRDLSVAKRPPLALIGGDVLIRGRSLRPAAPRLGMPRVEHGGLVVRVKMHPGQVPEQYAQAAEAMAHAFKVFRVLVHSEQYGYVHLRLIAWDPLANPTVPAHHRGQFMRASVGQWEDGFTWHIDLREIPHWLIVGATRSGKSTLLAALVTEWARQPLALVGIDLKGGMELGLFEPRLSALATTRAEATDLLEYLVDLALDRMRTCRAHAARSIWDLPENLRPVPVVVLVDEVAELYLMASNAEKAEVARVSTALLRIGQLGAALGVHLLIAGQRVGSDLGTGVTALRAQLGGRVCHRVNDPATAEMVLGDVSPDAVVAAQQISPTQQGVVIGYADGRVMRGRSLLVTPDEARRTSARYAHMTPPLPVLQQVEDAVPAGAVVDQ